MTNNELANQITQMIERHEAERQATIDSLHQRVAELERENRELRSDVPQGEDGRFTVSDREFDARLRRLEAAPFDTVIREAGVILENRIRHMLTEDGAKAHGVRLVDLAFKPNTGAFVVSDHLGEQEGFHMLYRGALQFIRNPPMHKLIEYPEATATAFVSLIDSLLSLLDDVAAPPSSDGISDTKQQQLEYWLTFIRFLKSNSSSLRMRKARPHYALATGIGRTNFALEAIVSFARDNNIGVRLVIHGDSAESAYAQLVAQKADIEREIGHTLDWNETPNQVRRTISLYNDGFDPNNREQWKDQHQWLQETLEAFQAIFRPRI